MQGIVHRTTSGEEDQAEARASFRELHGRRLHGFALLVTLGNRPLAARLSAEALAAAALRRHELRHPERAAAWLRARVLSGLPRRVREPSPADERVALEPLDVDRAVIDGLAALSVRERAALVASDVERLDARDVADLVGRSGRALERLLSGARRRYMRAHAAAPLADASPDGQLVARIRDVAHRALA
jgi:DNA-directed RNA polymerase specialized sigma24 family protein